MTKSVLIEAKRPTYNAFVKEMGYQQGNSAESAGFIALSAVSSLFLHERNYTGPQLTPQEKHE
ncbi:MAG: hypothetical protein C5B59_19655 [Bacteroidetes bacterium]|nr:MAG: hypothetical protein C5B59_19655 [Bacteroidota bacterium]